MTLIVLNHLHHKRPRFLTQKTSSDSPRHSFTKNTEVRMSGELFKIEFIYTKVKLIINVYGVDHLT